MLNIAKLDSKTLVLQKSNNNLREMLEEIKKNFKAMCEAYNTKIILNINSDCNIYCDKKWTEEAISNIIKMQLNMVQKYKYNIRRKSNFHSN